MRSIIAMTTTKEATNPGSGLALPHLPVARYVESATMCPPPVDEVVLVTPMRRCKT
jgi:hypothetical protein